MAPEILDNFHDLGEITIQIALEEAKVSVSPFFIGKKDRMGLGRSAYADDIQTLFKGIIDEMCPGKRIAANNDNLFHLRRNSFRVLVCYVR